MELRKRLALVALAYLAIFLIGGVVITSTLRTWTQQLDHRRDYLIATARLASLKSAYLDQETGVRGYIISGDVRFLEPYKAGMEEASALADQVRATLVERGIDPAMITDIVDTAQQWRDSAAAPAIAQRQATGQETTTAETDAAKQLFDQLRLEIDKVGDVISSRLKVTEANVNEARNDVISTIAVVIGLVVLLTAVVAWLLQRWVVSPLESITAATERVGRGERAKIEASGPREMRDVAQSIERMQNTILRQRDTAVNAREAFEQNAVLAMQIRNELAHDVGDYPEGWTVAAGLRPAEGLVAGDCYDVSLLGPAEIGLVVLDIAGHGALAAVSAFRCKELLKVALRNGLEPGSALDWLVGQDVNLEEGFFTAFVASIDTNSGRCRYANAGHPPALLLDEDRRVVALEPTGPLFGHVTPAGWRTAEVLITPGSMLTVYTDGLIEARNESRQFYGDDRLATVLESLDCPEAQPVVDQVLDDLSSFHAGRVADDVTLVVLCRGHSPSSDSAPTTMNERAQPGADANEAETEDSASASLN